MISFTNCEILIYNSIFLFNFLSLSTIQRLLHMLLQLL
ncbi:unnamed protein product [Arabidopsis halleri]